MKRNIIMASLLAICAAASAQGLGIQLGYMQDIERYRIGSSSKYDTRDPLNGLQVGLVYEYDFYKGLGVSTGLSYDFAARSSKTNMPGSYAGTQKSSRVMHSFAVPVMLDWRIQIAKNSYVLVFGGPTLNLGLYYKGKTTYDTPGIKKDDLVVDFYADDATFYQNTALGNTAGSIPLNDRLSRFNLQMGFGAGLQFQQFQIKGGYDWGLLNLYRTDYYSNTAGSTRVRDRQDRWYVRTVYFF